MSSGGEWEHRPLLVDIVLSLWHHPYIVQLESLRQEDRLGQASYLFPVI